MNKKISFAIIVLSTILLLSFNNCSNQEFILPETGATEAPSFNTPLTPPPLNPPPVVAKICEAKLPTQNDVATIADFNNDGKSDVFWRNKVTGANHVDSMSSFTITESKSLNVAGIDWTLGGSGDFNGDGKDDVAWYNTTTNQIFGYLMDGAKIIEAKTISFVAAGWEIKGVGDFNGDGKSDILLRNNISNRSWVYLMNGLNILASAGEIIGATADPTWKIKNVADFNGDGKADILWRNNVSNRSWIYLMNGINILGPSGSAGEIIGATVDPTWKIKAVGDFNGDGKNDIFWRNSITGQNHIYLMSTSAIIAQQEINIMADLSWDVKGAGDFNGDGKSDILWHNSSALKEHIYLMNDFTIVTNQDIGPCQ